MKPISQHAIVIDASMGGPLAARTLSDFLCRRHGPGARYVPGLGRAAKGRAAGPLRPRPLGVGRAVVENFFPGWTDEVVASGGAVGDIAGDVN
jgi:hypothetical protein